MQHQLQILKNELKTLFIHSPSSTAASVQIWFRAGSALEESGDEGIAHFLEHMFFKGTEKRPGASIAHDVESFGGEINAFTSFDYTCYYINTPNTQIQKTIEILLDMVSNPMFKMDDLIPERDVVFEEYRRSLDNPNHYSFHNLQKKCFKSGYAHPILGSEETIKNFSTDQLRKFRNNNYNLTNALFVVAGDLNNKSELVSLIEKYSLPKGPATRFPQFEIKDNEEVIDVHERDVRMAQLTFVWQAPEFESKDSAAEDLALNCIGYGETSRLYKELVQNTSLANNCSASTMFMSKGGAHFAKVIFPTKNLKKILDIIHTELTKIKNEGFGQLETQKIKNQYLSSKIYEMESVESYAFSLGHSFAQNGNYLCEEEFLSRIKSTNSQEVHSAFKNVIKRPMHLFLQVPKGESLSTNEKLLKDFSKSFKKEMSKDSIKEQTLNVPGIKSKYDEQVRLITLKKGVQLIYRKNTMTPTFVMHAYLNGGLSFENSKNNGMYNIISSMLTSGHGDWSNDQLKQDLEDKTAMLNGFSGKNAYGLTLHGLTEHFPNLLQHFIGSLSNPTFPAKYFDHEIEMTLRALENQKEDPVKHCFMDFSKIIFGTHPYSYNPMGTKQNLKRFNVEKLKKFHLETLQKSELLFTYCGDMDYSDLIHLLNQHLSKFKPRSKTRSKKPNIKTQYGKSNFIKFDREQTQIMMGIKTFPVSDPKHIYLKILSAHLSGQSSELFVEVRDRQGLCYSAQPIHFLAKEAGYFGIYMASGHDKVERAIKAIKDILEKIKNNGLTEEEFERVKTMLEGQAQINVQTNDDYANLYSVPVFQGSGLDFYFETNNTIKNLTYKDFQKNIKQILNAKWNQVVVGR